MASDREAARLSAAQGIVAERAQCDDRAALRLMIDRGLVQGQSLEEIVDGVLDGTIAFVP